MIVHGTYALPYTCEGLIFENRFMYFFFRIHRIDWAVVGQQQEIVNHALICCVRVFFVIWEDKSFCTNLFSLMLFLTKIPISYGVALLR